MPEVFWKLFTPKNVVTRMHSRNIAATFFATPFGSQCVNGSQKLLKSAREHFRPTFFSLKNG